MSNAKEVIKDWKKNKGFPYYPTDKKWKDKEYQNLLSFNRDTILDAKNQIIGQSTHGLSLAWSYMPHAWSVKCGKMKTPMEIWEDEEHLEKGINKILTGTFFKQKSANNITDSDMRAMLRRYSGTQMVSNFRPTAAATLYDIFVDKDSPLEGTEAGTVWDPSMGYGGRLMGAIAAGVNYIGTDPCVPTYAGLEKIRDEYGHSHKKYTLLRQGSETYIPEENSLDFVFTSPPYLGHEQYGDEEEQSFKKFPVQDQWRNGFLLQTIKNAYRGLKPGKYAGFNVANVKSYKTFEEDTYDCMVEAGFKDIQIWWLSLSTQQGTQTQSTLEGDSIESKQKNNYIGRFARPDIPGRKYEPIFIGIK
jgi:hypothetical protein